MPVLVTPTKKRPSKRASRARKARIQTSRFSSMIEVYGSALLQSGHFRTWIQKYFLALLGKLDPRRPQVGLGVVAQQRVAVPFAIDRVGQNEPIHAPMATCCVNLR